MELLALDFDGVISDSAPEAFVVALRTYAALRADPVVARMRRAADARSPDEIRADPLYDRFVSMMPLGNRAEDYAVEITLLARDADVRDQAAFDAAFAAEAPSFLQSFHERFYGQRQALRAAEPVRWTGLLGPYPELLPVLRRRARDVGLAIATAKDRSSVRILLCEYGIDDLFPDDRLLDKEAGRSKRAHLEQLHERTGVPYGEIVFIDDKVNHLEDVAPMGVQAVLAGWGYNGERERSRAQACGYRVATLEGLDSEPFGSPKGTGAAC